MDCSGKLSIDEERFRLYLDVTGDGYWEWNPPGPKCYFSPSYYTMLGYSPKDFTLDNWHALIHPDDVDKVDQALLNHLNNNQELNIECRLRCKSGYYKWVNSRGSVVNRDQYGNPTRMIGVNTDLSKRKATEVDLYESQRFLTTLISNLPGFVYRCKNNPDWEMEYLSNGVFDLTGYRPEEIVHNKTIAYNDLIAPEYRETIWHTWQELLKDPSGYFQGEYPIITAHGQTKWVFEQGRGVFSPEKELLALEGFVTDITARKQAEKALHTEKELLRVTLESIGEGVITTDQAGRVIMINQAAQDLTGWTPEEAFGQPAEVVFHLLTDEDNQYTSPVKSVLQSGDYTNSSCHTLLLKDFTQRIIAYNAAPIRRQRGQIHGVILVFRDITKEKEREQDIIYLNFHDALTGLYNRAFFEEELSRLSSSRNYPLTVIMGDVNGLKMVNDIYGHHQGDELLRRSAQVLRKACRADDIIARWGGDEFIILLPKTDNLAADNICERIRNLCSQMGTTSIPISIALGYATRWDNSNDTVSLLKEAEDYMYKAKLLESKSLRSSVILSMRKTLYERSHETEEHAFRLGHLSRSIGTVMGLMPNQLNELELLGTLHDIGKIAIKDSTLLKAGPLNDEEWTEMKRHPEVGFRIAMGVPELAQIAEYILCHHERWDGRGYPQGLKGNDIPLLARILAVVDTFDAITNDRPYRPKKSLAEAKQEIADNAGTQFDPEIVNIFIESVFPAITEDIA